MDAEPRGTGSKGTGPAPRSRPARNPASRARVERVLARSVAVFGLLYGVEAIAMAIVDRGHVHPVWNAVFVGVTLVTLAAVTGAAMAGRSIAATGSVFIAGWFAVMLLWPYAVEGVRESGERPWPWYLSIAVVATASVAWRLPAASAALVAVPVAYYLLRISPAGGGAVPAEAALDTVRSMILGLAALVIVTMLRRSAATADRVQAEALDRFSNAIGQQATEEERVQVDAIVHDTVLAALLSAAKADSVEAKALATRMATDAIASLRDAVLASPDDEPAVTLPELERRIRTAADNVAPAFGYRAGNVGGATIPARAARAVQSATLQAMVNSVQHAGDGPAVERSVRVEGTGVGGIRVEVSDTGSGFDPASITDRVGVRVSIIERVATAGGAVDLRSAPGLGTSVVIEWPSPDNPGRLPHLVGSDEASVGSAT